MKNKRRIKVEKMTLDDMVAVMADGLPGVVLICYEILKRGNKIDRDAISSYTILEGLDRLGIYGSRIGRLYKDVCGNNLSMMIAVLRADQLGQLAGVSESSIKHAIDNYGEGLDLKAIKKAVKKRLPKFRFSRK